MKIRKIKLNDLKWMRDVFVKRWGADFVVSRGKIHRPEELEGFVAEVKNKKVYPLTIDKITRKLKPQIAKVGAFGIPIRDEIELEMKL